MLLIRPDPKRIAELIAGHDADAPAAPVAPLGEILRRPGVRPAMLAALASFGVMVSVMNLSGYVIVEHHHHEQHDVFPVIGAHVFGMYALVLVVGTLIDRDRPDAGAVRRAADHGRLHDRAAVGRRACSLTALLLFGLGVGWNLSFVAATAQLADAASAAERGRLLGFNDTALRAARRGARAARRLRARLDRRRRAGARGDGDRRRPGALAAAVLAARRAGTVRAVTRDAGR